ncbi:MAG: restriction endonuclease subunit S [bacterium]|nr:restriction endonuclease subunit S [bacterium]MCM1422523.1 restriction endonuclease subunit S [bacterium]
MTERLDTDSNVDEMLKNIQEEKEKLVAGKKIKKEKQLPEIRDEDIPFEIPDNWKWERLKNIVYSGGQKVPDKRFSYIDIGSIDNIHQKLNNEENIIEVDKAPSRARKIVNYGDVLYATVRPYLHNMCIIDRNFNEEPIASTGFAVMTCCKGILNKFLLFYMLSPEFDRYANSTENAKGVAYPAINDDKFYRALVPIPPIEEQQRIVDRINEIMPKIDEYEKIEKELEALKKNFPTNMKDALFQAAMQGKLTEQLESDSSVDELLQEIKEKELRGSDWKAKKEYEIDEILDIIDSPIIPNSWKWVKLSDIAFSNIGLTYQPSDKTEDGVIVLRSSNIQNGKMDYNDIVKVNMKIPKNKMCDIGDILMCVRNGSKSLVGKVAVIDKTNMSFGAFMSIIRGRCNQFLYYFFASNMFKKQMHINSSTETINQITQDMLFNCVIPLPPIEEQQRIVERLNALLPLCEDLGKE